MKKIALASLCCAALFAACSGDSSSIVKISLDESDIIARTYDDLPVCSDSREGVFAYIKDEMQAYTCHNKTWTPNEDSLPSQESSSSKAEDDSSSSEVSSSSEAAGTKDPSSSATDKPSSSEAKSSAAESSSSAEPKSSATSSSSAKSSSSVASRNIDVGAYQYEWTSMDFLNVSIYNNEAEAIDSLTLRLFFTAKPEQVDSCATLIDFDICQIYNEQGYNSPCENDREIRDHFRHAFPIRIESSYDSTAGTYTFFFPVPLGSTTIASKSRMRLDIGFSSGISSGNYHSCETLRMPAKKRFSKDSSDWSWTAHKKDVDGADFAGIPLWDKDRGDTAKAPIDPYISVYRKDELISGIKHPNL